MIMQFEYDARTADGTTVQGTIAAESLTIALAELTRSGYTVIGIRLLNELADVSTTSAVSLEPVVATKALIVDILSRVVDDIPNRSQRRRVEQLIDWLQLLKSDSSVSSVPRHLSQWLPMLHAMARHAAADHPSRIVAVLKDELTDERAPHRVVAGALVYPAIIGSLAIAISLLVRSAVIAPMSADINSWAVRTIAARQLHDSDVTLTWLTGLFVLMALLVVWRLRFKTSGSWWIEYLPLLKTSIRHHAWSQIARRCAQLVEAGADRIAAFGMAAEACEFESVRRQARQWTSLEKSGSNRIGSILYGAIPRTLVALSGLELPPAAQVDGLRALAAIYRDRAQTRAKTVSNIVRVLGIVCVGAIIVYCLSNLTSLLHRIASLT